MSCEGEKQAQDVGSYPSSSPLAQISNNQIDLKVLNHSEGKCFKGRKRTSVNLTGKSISEDPLRTFVAVHRWREIERGERRIVQAELFLRWLIAENIRPRPRKKKKK